MWSAAGRKSGRVMNRFSAAHAQSCVANAARAVLWALLRTRANAWRGSHGWSFLRGPCSRKAPQVYGDLGIGPMTGVCWPRPVYAEGMVRTTTLEPPRPQPWEPSQLKLQNRLLWLTAWMNPPGPCFELSSFRSAKRL